MINLRLCNGTNYVDQTGIALFKLENDTWEMLHDDPNFIMQAQDTRIYRVNGEIILSYNDESHKDFPIRFSTLKIKDVIFLSEPSNLLKNSWKLDKNATLVDKNLVQYDFLNGKFTMFKDDKILQTPVFHFERLANLYKSKIFFSVSTPAIQYKKDTFLAVGHTKINYHHEFSFDPELDRFVKSCKPKYHENYIYTMFFYEFSLDGQIQRLSFSFIPIEPNEIETHLSFAMGLFEYQDNIYITFGEEDTKTKIIQFEKNEIEALLDDDQKFSETYKIGFLIKKSKEFNQYLENSRLKNCFTFNNSMIHWKDNLFIMVYRILYLNSEQEYRDPMEIWKYLWELEWKRYKNIS